jgi:hypothetical protein
MNMFNISYLYFHCQGRSAGAVFPKPTHLPGQGTLYNPLTA